MWRPASLALLIALFTPITALGQIRLLDEEKRLRSKQPPNISTDLMDPAGTTRLHLTTRTTFTDDDEIFSDNSAWTFDLQAFLRIRKGWAVQAALPFGLISPGGGNNEFLVGNIRLGTAAGFEVRLQPGNRDVRSARFKLGGGFDIYLPTASTPDGTVGFGPAVLATIRAIHSFEPELFIDDAMLFRLRGHAQLSFDVIIVETELGWTPGFTLEGNSESLFLVSWAARISVKPIYAIDPYLEAASSFHVVGRDEAEFRDYDTPVWITPGIRFHFGSIDPAVFLSFNVDDFAVLFGIDLAGAAREYIRVRRDNDDFLESFD